MTYSTLASYKMPISYGASGSRGYKIPTIATNYPDNRIAGYASSNPVYASFKQGQQIYEKVMRKRKMYEQNYEMPKESLNRNIPTIRIEAPPFSNLSSFLSSALGSGSKGKGKNN